MREPAGRSRAAVAGTVTGRTLAALLSAVVLAASGYGWVEVNRGRDGITTTDVIKTIENLTGGAITVNRYAEVNLASFYEISQAVGGVTVCLNQAARESNSGINLPAGQQVISGAQALAFVRQRYDLPRGDLDRI